VSCALVKNLESNHAMWVKIIDDENQQTQDVEASDVSASSSSVTDNFIYIVTLMDGFCFHG